MARSSIGFQRRSATGSTRSARTGSLSRRASRTSTTRPRAAQVCTATRRPPRRSRARCARGCALQATRAGWQPSCLPCASAVAIARRGLLRPGRARVDDTATALAFTRRMSASHALQGTCAASAPRRPLPVLQALSPPTARAVPAPAVPRARTRALGGRPHALPAAKAFVAQRARSCPSRRRALLAPSSTSRSTCALAVEMAAGARAGRRNHGLVAAAASVWPTRRSRSRAPPEHSRARRVRPTAQPARSSRFAALAARRPRRAPLAPSAAAAASAAKSSARTVRVAAGARRASRSRARMARGPTPHARSAWARAGHVSRSRHE